MPLPNPSPEPDQDLSNWQRVSGRVPLSLPGEGGQGEEAGTP